MCHFLIDYLLMIFQILLLCVAKRRRNGDVPFRLNCKLIHLSKVVRMWSIHFFHPFFLRLICILFFWCFKFFIHFETGPNNVEIRIPQRCMSFFCFSSISCPKWCFILMVRFVQLVVHSSSAKQSATIQRCFGKWEETRSDYKIHLIHNATNLLYTSIMR